MRILVIEDSELHQDSARKTLADHDVFVATDFKEGKKALQDQSFDVLLTDMNLPTVAWFKDEFAYGFLLVLLAASKGVKYAALLTDINHHKTGLSDALDLVGPAYYTDSVDYKQATKFKINGMKAIFVHSPFLAVFEDENGYHQPKDWGRVLADLIQEE